MATDSERSSTNGLTRNGKPRKTRRDEDEGEPSASSRSLMVGDADQRSGFFTPVWEHQTLITPAHRPDNSPRPSAVERPQVGVLAPTRHAAASPSAGSHQSAFPEAVVQPGTYPPAPARAKPTESREVKHPSDEFESETSARSTDSLRALRRTRRLYAPVPAALRPLIDQLRAGQRKSRP